MVREQQVGEPDGYLCIPQSQHAAISGQLARAWGNEAFPAPSPRVEVCVAAERHDDGMDPFDDEPQLDPESGLPRSFMKMPLDLWLECWSRGPQAVAEASPYAGMLVSLHGEHLLGYRRLDEEPEEGRAAAEAWQREQSELRRRWHQAAAENDRLAPMLDDELIERNRKLIEIWDAISLAVCMPRLPESFGDVPAEALGRAIEMREVGVAGGPRMIEADPWPFSASEVPLAASGRRLERTYTDETEMREALSDAPPVVFKATLVPPRPS